MSSLARVRTYWGKAVASSPVSQTEWTGRGGNDRATCAKRAACRFRRGDVDSTWILAENWVRRGSKGRAAERLRCRGGNRRG